MTTLNDPRYPIGRFTAPPVFTPALRSEHIAVLRDLPSSLQSAVSGLNDTQLDTPYREGGWTVRQVVHHVADSHANSYVRFKLALTEDWPTIKPYDEGAWANLPDGRSLPLDSSLSIVSGVHQRLVAMLESMTEADFDKGFNHPERGRMSLATNLALYAWHSRHHTAHITGLRERMGW